MSGPRLWLFDYRLFRAYGNRRWVALTKTAYWALTHGRVYINEPQVYQALLDYVAKLNKSVTSDTSETR